MKTEIKKMNKNKSILFEINKTDKLLAWKKGKEDIYNQYHK